VRRETFATDRPLRLDLRLPSGEIDVESIDGTESVVELRAANGSDAAREVVENATIELRSRADGDELRVDVERKRLRFFDFGRGDLVLRVLAPHGAAVAISTASADVRGRGRFGELEVDIASGELEWAEVEGRATVKGASGDVRIEAIGGDASVHTASGDVRIGRIGGDGVVRSASGDVAVDEAAGSLTVQTASGDQRVSSIESGRVTLQSASGDQLVGVRRGTRVRIDAKTMSGETSSELEPGEEAAADAPAVELRATAMSGDIRIVRA
jgi:DUF4097 and DUF4098 domain-containing protein YvlB